MKATKHDNLPFFRALPRAIALSLPFWAALVYGAYKLLKLFGY